MNALDNLQLHLVDDLDTALALKRWLGERRDGRLGFDTETGGLEWWRVPIRLVQVGDRSTGWAIPWEDWAGLVKEVFRDYEGELVAHNATYDLHMLETNGVKVKRHLVHDTATQAHVIDSSRPKSLKFLASKLVDPRAAMGEEILSEAMSKNRWDWSTVPVTYQGYWTYGALDPVITSHLDSQFASQLKPFQAVYDLEMAVGMLLMDMERRGIRIDLDYVRKTRDSLLDFVGSATSWVEQHYGFSPGSNAKVAEQLLRDGALLHKKTPSGAWSADSEVLEEVVARGAHQGAFAQTVLNLRKARQFANAYFGRMLELEDDGILHASIDPLGARTARMSISKPPLQQMPSDSPLIRDAFIPSAEDRRISPIDYDQIEVRLLAHFAQEADMIKAIHDGVDMHWFAARKMYGPDATKAQRKQSKSGTFGKIYGIGARKFARQQGVTESEARQFLALYDSTFPGVARFIDNVQGVARARHLDEGQAYIDTPVGRRHRLRPEDGDGYYKLVNYLIQGTAADVLKQQLVALEQAGFGEYMRLPVHDEILFDWPDGEADELALEAKRVMEDHTTFAVPLTVEVSHSRRWGDSYDLCKDGRHAECTRAWCTCTTCGRA